MSKNTPKRLSLIEKAKLQMSSSLLRMVDESLYTSESSAIRLDRDEFINYHKAYSQVSNKWPLKPIDYIIKFIQKRRIGKKPLHKLKFADIGCGPKPLLKQKLPKGVKVQSFDLVSTHKDIVEANMANLPIENSSVDCAVFSLSLMPQDLGKILLEAKRVLKMNGSLIIVEVTSRFDGKERRFVNQLKRIGFAIKSTKALSPNSYFTFFHFKKTDMLIEYSRSDMNIRLKACSYKAR